MPIEAGCVVKSIAGHDANSFYVVTSVQDGYVTLADGKVRMLERPKRKSVKHIRKTNEMLDLSGINTNKKLRNALRAFCGKEGGTALV
ncbi:KOW domain-containing RNA-binding protein [Oscillospiraceae bacterium PP1C4]